MILLLLALVTPAQCESPPESPIPRPEPPAKVDGECDKTYAISKGQSLPEVFVTAGSKCSAVAVPLSDYADLLQTETWAKAIDARYKIDTAELERERDWYKSKLEEELQPLPWLERPSTQRWLGRLETLTTVVVVAASAGAAYHYGAGGTR
jgi:hypothetical protein